MSETFLSIVVPTYNGLEHLGKCMPSILSAVDKFDLPCEIIVVDDCSTDASVDWLEQNCPRVKVIRRSTNAGFAITANDGIRSSNGLWVALINNDVVLDEKWISNSFSQDISKDVGAIATKILYYGRENIINSAGDEYTSCGVAIQRLDTRPVEEDSEPENCFSACAAAAIYRREALDKVGLFRQSLGAYYEDVDLGFRLNLAGWFCRYSPQSKCWHIAGGSYGRKTWNVLYNSARNREVVFWANMPVVLLIRYGLSHLLVIFLQLCWSVFAGGFLPKLCGTFAALSRISEICSIRKENKKIRSISSEQLKERFERHWFRELVVKRFKKKAF